jgi:hypothetical protein
LRAKSRIKIIEKNKKYGKSIKFKNKANLASLSFELSHLAQYSYFSNSFYGLFS